MPNPKPRIRRSTLIADATFLFDEDTNIPKSEDGLGFGFWDLSFGICLRSGAVDANNGAARGPAEKLALDQRVDHQP